MLKLSACYIKTPVLSASVLSLWFGLYVGVPQYTQSTSDKGPYMGNLQNMVVIIMIRITKYGDFSS